MNQDPQPEYIRNILGYGLDDADGHIRRTDGEDYTLLQGSEETHARMQKTLKLLEEQARKKGKKLSELRRDEFIQLAQSIPDPDRL